MNKSELIKTLAETKDLHIDEAADIVNAFVDSVKQALINEDRVEIRGFGSFKIKGYKGYTGRNPKSGDVVTVAPGASQGASGAMGGGDMPKGWDIGGTQFLGGL